MKKWFEQFKTEDWVVVAVSILLLAFAIITPNYLPRIPKHLADTESWGNAIFLFVIVLVILYIGWLLLGRPLKGLFLSLIAVFSVSLLAQITAALPQVSYYGFESVFFSVIFGLIIRNVFRVPAWMKPAIQSEFFIKIGVVCLGATILFSDVMKSGAVGLVQAVLVVSIVWFFAYFISRRLGVIVVPMIYMMPWLAHLLLPVLFDDPQVIQEVAGAWIGGTIDTTSGVAASSAIVSELSNQHAVIIKGAQNVLIGFVAFFIALYLSTRGEKGSNSPSLGIVWEKFPKFIIGFVAASLVFSIFQANDLFLVNEKGKLIEPGIAKMFSTVFFSLAFVCVGLETQIKDIVSRENRNVMWSFLTAQTFNILVTFIIACLLFGIVKPMLG